MYRYRNESSITELEMKKKCQRSFLFNHENENEEFLTHREVQARQNDY